MIAIRHPTSNIDIQKWRHTLEMQSRVLRDNIVGSALALLVVD